MKALLPWFAALMAAAVAFPSVASTDSQLKLLALKDKQVQMTLARSKLSRMDLLFERGGVGRLERDQAAADAELTEIRFQHALLEMLASQPRFAVDRAVKYRDDSGQHFLDLTVRNATLVLDSAQRNLLSSLDVENRVPVELLQRRLENVFVSVGEVLSHVPVSMAPSPASNVAIALPYEHQILAIDFGESATIKFKLLTDAERFNVRFTYRGSEQHIGIYPEQQFAGADIELASTQITQEADLGSAVEFPFVIRRSGQDTRTLVLRDRDIPQGIRQSFLDPVSKTRVSEIRLSTGETAKSLLLRLELPDRHAGGFPFDTPLPFSILAFDAGDAGTATGPDATVRAALDLKLIVRGVGRLVLNTPALVHELRAGDAATVRFSLRNEGSRSVENVRFDTEHPLGWQVDVDPPNVSELPVDAEVEVTLNVRSPESVAAGDFEMRLKTTASTATRPLAVEDKNFRLTIKREQSLVPILLVIALFLLVVAAIVYVGRKVRLR